MVSLGDLMKNDFDILERFKFGLNLDDPWRYSGMNEPKSIIIPHVMKIELKDSDTAGKIGEAIARAMGRRLTTKREEILALVDAISNAEIDFVRCWFPWNYFVEKVGDEYQYPMDDMAKALQEKGIALIPVIACGYSRMLPEGVSVDRDPSKYIEIAGEHARELVKHYRSKVWQIENEPNWWEMHEAAGWRNGVAWLEGKFKYELLKMLNDAVHEEDGNTLTLINLEADREIASDEITMYSSLSDIIGLDFYPNYQEPEPVDPKVITKAEDVAQKLGKNVVISETGYPSGPSWLGYSYGKQAEYVLRACMQAFECKHVSAISIWRYADTSWRSFPPQENHFGLYDEHLNSKPAYRVYADTIKQLKRDSQLSH